MADFVDKKTKFSFKEGATVQVIQKDPGGKWEQTSILAGCLISFSSKEVALGSIPWLVPVKSQPQPQDGDIIMEEST